MDRERIGEIILRIGLALSFLYPPVNAYFNPDSWIGYFPSFLKGFVPDLVLLHVFGAVEVLIAIWILSGWRIFWPSAAAALMLAAIVVFNEQDFEVLFRDLSVAAIAVALAVRHYDPYPWRPAA